MKKMLLKRMTVAVLAAAMVAVLPGAVAGAEGDGEEIVLRFSWWGSESRHEATLEALEKYHELNPNVTIEGEYSSFDTYYQKLVTQFAGGTAPDIIQIDQPWISDFAGQGEFFENLNDYGDIIDITKFEQDYLEGWCMNGDRLEALPLGLNGYTLMYNKNVIADLGIDLDETTQWTWNDLIEAGKLYKEKYPDGVFLHTDTNTLERNIFKPYLIQQYGGYFINPDYTMAFTKENLIAAYEFLLELQELGLIQPLNETAAFEGKIDQNPAWVNGEAALCIRWASDLQQLMNDNVDIGVARLPVSEDAKETAINCKPSMVAAIYSGSQYKEEAAKFIAWMTTSEEGIATLADCRGIPATEDARTQLLNEEKLNGEMVEAINIAIANAGTPQNGLSDNAEITSISQDVMSKVLFEKITPEEGADELIKRVGEKLESLKTNS